MCDEPCASGHTLIGQKEYTMTFTKDDFIQICAACNGTGWIEDLPQDANSSYGRRQASTKSQTPCGVCHKTGKVLTEAGEAIASVVALLRQQGRF
jgi:hypothetical protein